MLEIVRKRPCAWKGLLAGVTGGLAATVVMTQFQGAWSQVSNALEKKKNGQQSDDQEGEDQQGEDATMKAAGKLAKAAGHELSRAEKKKAGPFIHYGFGAAMGAVYGLAHEFAPRGLKSVPPVLVGSGYGTALFVGADEVAVPALGLSQPAGEAPLTAHLYGWASHLVYGVTLEMVRKNVRRKL